MSLATVLPIWIVIQLSSAAVTLTACAVGSMGEHETLLAGGA
jgi:hypothetical protein